MIIATDYGSYLRACIRPVSVIMRLVIARTLFQYCDQTNDLLTSTNTQQLYGHFSVLKFRPQAKGAINQKFGIHKKY